MVFPLIEFGGMFFFILLGMFFIAEAAFIHNSGESAAITLFVIVVALAASLVGGWPSISWHWFAGYFIGGFVWIPIYWYLTLRKNRRGLLNAKGDYRREDYGIRSGDMWLPKHPDTDALAANGLLWFISMPVYAANDWINLVIDMFSGLMNRIQASLAVAAPVKENQSDNLIKR